jgi:uncharacterized phiE125 gp8 family phage protein
MALLEITPPAVEPLGFEEVRDHLRVTISQDDALIDGLIVAARVWAEGTTWRQLITATWEENFDAFPPCIRPQRPPLQSVVSITYIDTAGVEQTLDAAKYQVDAVSQPGRVLPAYGETWPSTRAQANAVTVRFLAGYGGAGGTVPAPIRQAMLMAIGHWYANREHSLKGRPITTVPLNAEDLLAAYRIWGF